MKAMRTLGSNAAAIAAFALLTACQSLPSNSAMLEEARRDYGAALEDPHVRELAKVELREAGDAMIEADRAWTRNEDVDEIEHMAYLAKQRVAIAHETALGKRAESILAQRARSREDLVPAQTTSEPAPNAQLDDRRVRLSAEPTEDAAVIVISGLLFDTGRTRLDASGLRSIDKLAAMLNRHTERKAMVEGFTDNAGSEAMNEVLSCRRADAVRAALVERGVGAERVGARGYGKAFPVAGNETAAGRRLNRRVEIGLSDDTGKLIGR